ncbi:hypothetical protein BH09BAC3_BH09BAC3_19920 [soil metagenome]
MSLKSLQPRTTALIVMILLAAAFRLVQSSPVFSILSNVTPVGAIALFGGCYFKDRWRAFLVPLSALLISDILLNLVYYPTYGIFYPGMIWIYGSFALIVLLGHFIKKVTVPSVLVVAISAGVIHWLVSDFGTWLGPYPDVTTGLPFTKDLSGYIRCLTLALPFLKNMVIGNLVFCGVLFGAFEWMQQKYPTLKTQAI